MKPTVCCVMLVNGRPEMVARAIRSFRAQTYEAKRLMILDTGLRAVPETPYGQPDATTVWAPDWTSKSIGWLRNAVNGHAAEYHGAKVFAHLDSDDWSHPRRLEEQVELLERSGKECVGYNEMLFWDCEMTEHVGSDMAHHNGAWLYRLPLPGWALGTSLMYWRSTWERNPFEDLPRAGSDKAEDTTFLRKVSCHAESSVPYPENIRPRMIATIHGGNTSQDMRIVPSKSEWRRVAEWDARVRSIMGNYIHDYSENRK